MKLLKDNVLLLVIDVQEKIFATLFEKKETEINILRLIRGAGILGIPIIWTEQYPKGLGHTIASVRKALRDKNVQEKITFSCLENHDIATAIMSLHKSQALVCGIEAHVCVYQTALDLMERGIETHIASDAVMSRKELNYHLALEKLRDTGAFITSVEMALFELQKIAKGETFKAIADIIK